jgi:hypothetical protein
MSKEILYPQIQGVTALRVRARVVHGALAWLVVPATQRIAPCRVCDTIVYPEPPVYPPVHSMRVTALFN